MNIRLQLFALLATSVFSFATPPQTVAPNTISKPITVSMPETTTETFDLDFQSTSPTGKFLSASGSSISKIMARGTKSRTFYYQDSTTGESTITVTAIGRVSKKTFVTSQEINIVSSVQVVKVQKPATYIQMPSQEIATSTVVPKIQSVAAATIYSAPAPADPLAGFFAVSKKMWKWLAGIF